ncbi:hypothetical protein EVAR_102665_1 [Eumeta japonica]|uniref:Uncharacterized protein n=1 Tax=Eumeta variegata TaxID=151549 RepID=A0A4C1TVU7_EUMVA|nr:hypothetical protein EVAR_102665_1 [Eumeta japonica]
MATFINNVTTLVDPDMSRKAAYELCVSVQSLLIRHPIPSRKAGNAPGTPLEFRVSTGDGDHLFSDDSSPRLLLDYAIKKSILDIGIKVCRKEN